MREPPPLPGAEAVVAWWGRWIGFHDFELSAVPPEGADTGELRIHGWVTHADVDARGCFRRSDHCVVRILLSGIRSIVLHRSDTPALPAILFELRVEAVELGWCVTWDSSYGCAGMVEAAAARLVLEPIEAGRDRSR